MIKWLPCVKGAPPQAVRDCFLQPVSATPASVLRTLANPFHRSRGPPPLTQGRRIQTRLDDACKRASHTRKSLQPLRGFRTRLGDACKRASHTCKSLYTREPFLIKSRLCRTTSLRFSLLSQKSPAEAELFCLCHHIDVVIPFIRYFRISAGI